MQWFKLFELLHKLMLSMKTIVIILILTFLGIAAFVLQVYTIPETNHLQISLNNWNEKFSIEYLQNRIDFTDYCKQPYGELLIRFKSEGGESGLSFSIPDDIVKEVSYDLSILNGESIKSDIYTDFKLSTINILTKQCLLQTTTN